MANEQNKAQELEKLLDSINEEVFAIELARTDVYALYADYCEADNSFEEVCETAGDFIDVAYAYIRRLENLARLQSMALVNLKTKGN